MICPNCNKEYAKEEMFCRECGAKLEETENAATEAEIKAPMPDVYEAMPVEAVPPVDVKPQPPKANGCAAAFFSVFLCFLIFILSVPTLLIGQVRTALSPMGLKNTVNAIAPEDILIENEEGIKVDVLEYIVDIAEEYGDEYVDINTEDVRKFMEESSIIPFVTDKVAEVVNSAVFEEKSVKITEEEIRQLLDENTELLGEFGFKLDEEIKEEIVSSMASEGVFDKLNFEIDLMMADAEPVLSVLRAVFSYKTMGALGFVILLLSLLIVAINRYDKLKALTYVGVTFIIVGVIFSLPALAVLVLSDLWLSLFAGAEMVGTIVSSVIRANIILPLSVLILGILFVVIRAVVRSASLKKAAEN